MRRRAASHLREREKEKQREREREREKKRDDGKEGFIEWKNTTTRSSVLHEVIKASIIKRTFSGCVPEW